MNFRHSAETTELFFGRNRIFAESHRSIFGRKRNWPKQFKLLFSAPKPKPKPNFGRSLPPGIFIQLANSLQFPLLTLHSSMCEIHPAWMVLFPISHLILVLWPHVRLPPKRHLDLFSRFCTTHPADQHTDRHIRINSP